ncbi:MAG: tannase/feruloyl esterase family alpha/beta hydrolase [Streptosporangiales bacterium]|nr:tannase/feruloyl esterase family alpha/beta hydrolase [Streptosporangiales bacterium]
MVAGLAACALSMGVLSGTAAPAEAAPAEAAPTGASATGGPGPEPTGQFEALVRWVEHGRAPRTLDAVRRDAEGNVTRSRPLCPYPLVARYIGGDPDSAASFRCARDYGPPKRA